MKKFIFIFLLSIASLAFADDASFERVTKEADKWGAYPAAIILTAPTASIQLSGDQTTLALNEVSQLAGIIYNLQKKDRTFDAFPTKELPEAWNVCNAMKQKNHIFHSDDIDAMMLFDVGPKNRPVTPYLSNAPLISTAHGNHRTISENEGFAKLMLLNARLSNGIMTFDVTNGAIASGSYSHVTVVMECIQGGVGLVF